MKAFWISGYATYKYDETCAHLRASGGDCGGAVKFLSFAVDLYNQNVTGEISMPVQSARSDPHHLPCVIEICERELSEENVSE